MGKGGGGDELMGKWDYMTLQHNDHHVFAGSQMKCNIVFNSPSAGIVSTPWHPDAVMEYLTC